MTPAFVLDASAAVCWFLPDEQAVAAEAALSLIGQGSVPHVGGNWHLEVTQALLGAARRRRISAAGVSTALARLRELPLETHGAAGERAFTDLRALAETRSVSVYDAVYLDLALRLSLPLATADELLARAAKAAGVKLVAPIRK